ncbi:unnamed protein product [Acanthoscelides obtectus]|uniref:Ubiquitin-like domain-containing protein n=1 Tax=Acanthoscelides obtectus TaxID=200917 RepID=A0A9P0VS91_ACAOB|nr:unnamed protein product [Acanthoscelides obtectus]CAK1623383.1 E3 ubiquitin-protein ligase UHRF1 [Acanthoscelides obtectus]
MKIFFLISNMFSVSVNFFLVNDHSLSDYGINDGHVVSMVVKQPNLLEGEISNNSTSSSSAQQMCSQQYENSGCTSNEYYKVGEYVDVRMDNGAWYESEIVQITSCGTNTENVDQECIIFTVKSEYFI